MGKFMGRISTKLTKNGVVTKIKSEELERFFSDLSKNKTNEGIRKTKNPVQGLYAYIPKEKPWKNAYSYRDLFESWGSFSLKSQKYSFLRSVNLSDEIVFLTKDKFSHIDLRYYTDYLKKFLINFSRAYLVRQDKEVETKVADEITRYDTIESRLASHFESHPISLRDSLVGDEDDLDQDW